MRKFLLSLSVVVVVLGGLFGCSQQKKWNREQRQALRQMLKDYREMVYLDNLSEAEYMLFADEVAAAIEQDYLRNLPIKIIMRKNASDNAKRRLLCECAAMYRLGQLPIRCNNV